jgi:hypothetical protein
MARRLSALVIGNAAYVHGETLLNPVNDVVDISGRLTNLGFSVIKLIDATTEQMDRGLEAFGTELATSDVGLFFFAGHAFQIDGINFLAGVDTKSSDKLAVQYSALHLDKVIDTMKKAQAPTSIIILDACHRAVWSPWPAKKHPRPVLEPPHAARAANDRKFARAGIVLSARQLFVHRLQRSRADMYEHFSFARSRVWKFLEERQLLQGVQHGGMHQSPPFKGSRRFALRLMKQS